MPSSQACALRCLVARPRRWPCPVRYRSDIRNSSSIPDLGTSSSNHERPSSSTYADPSETREAKRRGTVSKSKVKNRSPSHNDKNLTPDISNIKASLEETLDAHKQANDALLKIVRVKSDAPEDQMILARSHQQPGFKRLELEKEVLQSRRGWKDYEGQEQPISLEWQPSKSLPHTLYVPWTRELKAVRGISATHRLKDEISAAATYFSPTLLEKQAADLAIQDIRDVISNKAPAVEQVDLIGSRASGMANPLSDIDVNLVSSAESTGDPSQDSYKILSRLYRRLRWLQPDDPVKSLVETTYFAASARVPIIAAVHIPTGLELQLQSATSSYGSLELCKSFVAEFPTLKGLFLVIKQMLHIRGLCNGSMGGLTSYPLLNMIVASLKIHAAETDPSDSAQQLLQFLEFYSDINFYEKGICHKPSKVLTDSTSTSSEDLSHTSELVAQDPIGAVPFLFDVRRGLEHVHDKKYNYMMTFLDPANLHNNLGKSVTMIKHIQATFLELRNQLVWKMIRWNRDERPDRQPIFPSHLLQPLIGADYSSFISQRKDLRSADEGRKAIRKVLA